MALSTGNPCSQSRITEVYPAEIANVARSGEGMPMRRLACLLIVIPNLHGGPPKVDACERSRGVTPARLAVIPPTLKPDSYYSSARWYSACQAFSDDFLADSLWPANRARRAGRSFDRTPLASSHAGTIACYACHHTLFATPFKAKDSSEHYRSRSRAALPPMSASSTSSRSPPALHSLSALSNGKTGQSVPRRTCPLSKLFMNRNITSQPVPDSHT